MNTGTLNLNDISGRVDVSSEGSIGQTATGANNLSNIKVAANGDVKLTGKNKLTAINIGAIGGDFELNNDSDKLTANFGSELTSKVTITQRGDIDLTGAVSGNMLSLTSATGNIISTGGLKAAKEINLSVGTFTHGGETHTDKLTIATDNGVKITNAENNFNALEIASRDGNAINGSIEVAMKADKFTPTLKNDVTGDVIGTTFSASSEGSIAQAAEKFIKADKIEVTATNDITLDNASNLIKAATITGGENIKLSSAACGGLKLEGLKVSGNADIISKRALELTGNIETGKDIALTAGTDLSSIKSSTLKTGNNITLKAKNVKILGKVETPYKKMTSDKVEDLKKFLKEIPVIMVTTNKGLDMRNGANSFDGVYVNSNGKQINGSVLVTGNSPEFLAVIDKAVLNDITLTNSNGAIILLDKGALKSNKGSITLDISGDFSAGAALERRSHDCGQGTTQDGDITITSNHETYSRRQKGITVEETGAINPGRNLYLNATNGSIEFNNVSAKNADIKTINGNVTAETISADDTIAIELEHGNLYLNLAQSKGVAILTDDSSESSVNTIRANSVDVNEAVKVGLILPYRSTSTIRTDTSSSTASSGYSGYNSYSNGYSNFANSSNFASGRNSYAILGTTLTNDGLTYWQNATSTAAPSYSFSEFDLYNDIGYMQTRNYFEVRFIPTWLESEFMDIDYSFDNFGIRNATANELRID